MPRSRIGLIVPLLCLLAFFATVISGCGGGSHYAAGPIDPGSPRIWTVLIYMAADNNLEEYGIADINELETVGRTDQSAILVQIDRRAGGDESNGGWTSTRRYRVTRDSAHSTIGSELLADLGELNMADPATLSEFIHWGVENYPAEHYLLVLWDHGRGWQTGALMVQPRVRAIHVDAASGYDEMSLPELEQALAAAPKLDIVLFDACLMGMIEVAYSLRDSADIMVASEEDIPLTGQPYQSLAGRLAVYPAIDPEGLASALVSDYISYYSGKARCTLSALDLTRVNAVVEAADELATTMSANLATYGDAIRVAATDAQHYDISGSYADYRDLHDFAARLRDSASCETLEDAASQVIAAAGRLVIAQRNTGGGVSDSHGVSIYLPTPATRSDALTTQYSGISFGRDTSWDEFFSAY